MYTNIRSAILDIVRGFESDTAAFAIEAEVEDEFSHMELCTINEQLGKMSYDQRINHVKAGNRYASTSELMHDFFNAVHNAL